MKPEYEKIVDTGSKSFIIRNITRKSRPLLSQAWHFHPEIEICYTEKSRGRRFVGNQIAEYEEDDLVMFGSNLPHGFTTDMFCSQVVIQFTGDFMGPSFINKPEMIKIKSLLERSKQGLEFKGAHKKKAIKIIRKLSTSQDGLFQFLELLKLLKTLTEGKKVKHICTKEYALDLNASQLGRIKIVYDHIMNNFKDEVRIKTIATKLNISEAAFYKFIKKHTHKTYTQIINEFRINHASKLLINSDKHISSICFESGYNNISYFNRKFKEIMHVSPMEFKKNYTNKSLI